MTRLRDVLIGAELDYPRFAAAVRHPEPSLLHLSVLLAEDLDDDAAAVERVDRQLGFLAYLVDREAGPAVAPLRRLAALRRVLGQEEGFHGSAEAYDEPACSYLAHVLDHKIGLPISLSVLYLLVAERLGWPLIGLDYPQHFLLRYRRDGDDSGPPLVIDPFDGGRVIDTERCLELAAGAMRNLPEPQRRALVRLRLHASAGPRAIVTRMLLNLKHQYLGQRNYLAVKNVIEKLLLLDNRSAGELRDLGGVFHLLGDHRRALECLRGYLIEAPEASDRGHVQAVVSRLRDLLDEDEV